jgi:tRNA pseudouridine13 synthase
MFHELSKYLKEAMAHLPYIAADLPGIGGVIKASPEHFQVEEVLPYAPCGEGEHVFVRLRRQGWNTADVGQALGRCFGLKSADVGWAGRKDKNAVTTQSFSLRLPMSQPMKEIESMLAALPFELVDLQRHRNKLKMGHVAANRFSIILSQVPPHALDAARAIADKIRQVGIPNYFGAQRFGIQLRNIDRAVALLRRGKARGKKEGFMVSALQSALFNMWLKERIEGDAFDTLMMGDLVQKTDTGGMFVVEDLQEAAQRFAKRKIIYTGPIFGHKMKAADDQAGGFERRLLESLGLDVAAFKPLRAAGTRRRAVLHLEDLTIAPAAEGLRFCFSLPSGAYATTVLREFTREPIEGPA